MTIVELKDGLLGEKVNIALVQLESPFNEELCYNDEKRVFGWIKKSSEKRKKKVTTILDNIIRDFKSQPQLFPDVIIFPEYSIPFEMLPELEKYSKDYKIIVAGSDQVRDQTNEEMFKKNVCPVIIQGMGTFFIEKNSVYEDEKDIVKEGAIERCNLQIHWTYGTDALCLQIFICLDYIDHHDLINREKKGGIVVIMCFESMKEYAALHNIDKRFGKFNFLCNAVSLNDKKPIMIGNSAIFGAAKDRDKNDAIVSVDGALEGLIFARLNFVSPYLLSPKQIPAINPVELKIKYRINSDFSIERIPEPISIYKKNAIINPSLFDTQLKLLKFVILKTDKYNVLRRKIEKLGEKAPFNSFGVFGDHDTVSMSFLSVQDDMKLKKNLKRYAQVSIIDVKNIIKFYGYSYDSSIPINNLANLLGNPTICQKLIHLSKDWDAPFVTEEEKIEFKDNHFILGDYEITDLKIKNFIRCFIRLDLVNTTTQLADIFEKQIIKRILSPLPGVKSIYQTASTPGFRCDYLIDVIDNPHSIFDLILKIHSEADKIPNTNLNSNTFVVVEQLSQGMFNKLCQQIKEGDLGEEMYNIPIKDIIKKGEGEFVEFKSSLRWDYREGCVKKDIELQIAKTIVAFMNTKDGLLLIGIDDGGNILGIDKDISTLKKKDKDGFELAIGLVIRDHIGSELHNNVRIRFEEVDGKLICKLIIKPSKKPAYLDKKEFYIRAGNSSQPLNMQQTQDYINMYWKKLR